jgi:2-C-methyl-D-erythritol 4-phosphate cytidylyltransferase
MNTETPKQYLPLAGRAVIEWSLSPFLAHPQCMGVVVVVSAADEHWSSLSVSRHERVRTAIGGTERVDSVRAGLLALQGLSAHDWVAVHDAARPCLSAADLNVLLDALKDEKTGALLATPVRDTLKRTAADARVEATVSRAHLWHALTPQIFPYGLLLRALSESLDSGVGTTDEAQAIERLGLKPRLVQGSADNLKITIAEDLARAARVLAS